MYNVLLLHCPYIARVVSFVRLLVIVIKKNVGPMLGE